VADGLTKRNASLGPSMVMMRMRLTCGTHDFSSWQRPRKSLNSVVRSPGIVEVLLPGLIVGRIAGRARTMVMWVRRLGDRDDGRCEGAGRSVCGSYGRRSGRSQSDGRFGRGRRSVQAVRGVSTLH
jgi:hypothetical protein